MTRAPAPIVERFVEISGRRVRVWTHGEGRPLLLVNGLGSNVATWTPLISCLRGFRAIAFDAPGVGQSQAPRLPYRMSTIADAATRVMDELGVDSADVLGYSLGGAVAQQLAHQRPERVRRLVLVSSSCGAGGVPGTLRATLAVMTPARHYARSGYRMAMKLIDLAPAEKESSVIREQIASWHHQAAPSVRGYALQMTAMSTFNSLPWLHELQQPTLVMSGTDDHLIPIANSAILAAHLPNSRLRAFERWGHYSIHDSTSGAGDAVADFLAAPDHTASTAWSTAAVITPQDMARFVRAAPRSAHPSVVTNRVIRGMSRPKTGSA